ncbi:MAG: hypothetical protein JWO36_3097 [Myxococcales bacterium]|nr:hypothetical protein [Myxococcales bacterium]
MDEPGCRSTGGLRASPSGDSAASSLERDPLVVGAGPVDLPRKRVEIELGRRRHRLITGPSGLVLFVCLFLPAIRGCHEPVYPFETPMFLPPYFYGLAFAFGAAAVTVRGMRNAIVAIRAITIAMLAFSAILTMFSPPVGIIELMITALIFAGIDTSGHSERRAASAATIVGAICTLWFGFWTATSDALLGAYLSLASSIGLLVGGLIWVGETAHQVAPLILIPRAVARRRE